MYAIVRAGGRQEKVAVGDTIVVDRLTGEAGDSVALPALLVVDGSTVTSDAAALAKVNVTAEIVAEARGPKIHILKFKNKTGYRKRQGHRSKLTELRVTAIDGAGSGRKKAAAKSKADAPASDAKASDAGSNKTDVSTASASTATTDTATTDTAAE